jgi:hypothetical protein
MPVVSDYRAILGYYENEAQRWNATQDLGFPAFVTYSFLQPSDLPSLSEIAFSSTSVRSMSAAQQQAVRDSLQLFENKSGLTFVETTGPAMIEMHTVTGSNWGGWAYLPYVTDYSTSSDTLVLDVTFGDLLSGFGFDIITHEIGHAVGLAHPHEGPYTLTPSLDRTSNTIMSYNDGFSPQLNLSPMDVQALTEIYGGPVDTSDWRYGFQGSTFEVAAGSGDDKILGVLGQNKLKGGKGDDTIIGREDNDILNGGNGKDLLIGGRGSDFLRGGNGNDRMYAIDEKNSFYDGGQHKLLGGKGHDMMVGGDGSDFLKGELGRDTMIGDSGNDTFVGGKDSDLLTGGFGADTFIFFAATDGEKDTITDFLYFQDKIDIRQITYTRDDIVLKEADNGRDIMLKIDYGEDMPFRIRFEDVTKSELERYFDSYHIFDVIG